VANVARDWTPGVAAWLSGEPDASGASTVVCPASPETAMTDPIGDNTIRTARTIAPTVRVTIPLLINMN
jgi:hypothetical protein